MQLFDANTYTQRRNALRQAIGSGLILIMGNEEAPMNYRDNVYPYRQNSNFLYFFGINKAGLNAVIDADSGNEVIFGDEITMDDIIWIGEVPSLQDLAAMAGVNQVQSPQALLQWLSKYKNDIHQVHYLPPYRPEHQALLSNGLGLSLALQAAHASTSLIKAIVNQRSIKSASELSQMDNAVDITRAMHIAAMQATTVGQYEYEVVGEIIKTCKRHHAALAYSVIFSINGQVLHNHHHDNLMNAGQLVLNDSGAENSMCYAGDITRTFPVKGKFDQKQKDIYAIVLEMEERCIDMVAPGVKYRDVHLHANAILIDRMKTLGILKGNNEDMLEQGVAGLFMPHGLGHMIGLDVHDMEDLGEHFVGYEEGQERAKILGLRSLRLARTLQPGFVLTVEPGIYFIPQLIEKYKAESKFMDYVNYDALQAYYSFGGIRIEDNVVVTDTGRKVLGQPIPKSIEEVELMMLH